jgi:hypothetical protein
VNLFVTIPAGDRGAGLFAAIGRALSHGPAILATHAALGFVSLIVRWADTRERHI